MRRYQIISKKVNHRLRELWASTKLFGPKNFVSTNVLERSSITSAGFGGDLSQNADTADALNWGWWSKPNRLHADTLKGRGGRVET